MPIHQSFRHAGAATPDILSTYISTIKSLREVDPKGVLLDAVGEPIKAYLRDRRDTIRCIVTSLTDDGSGGEPLIADSLFEELNRPADAEVRGTPSQTRTMEASRSHCARG
jgi:anaphase-promoting complex subunit 2